MNRLLSALMASFVLASAVVTMVGCDNENPVTPEPPDRGAVIGPQGGEITATGEDVSVTIEFPEGAVLDETTVLLQPLEPAAGQRARFRLEPAGLLLKEPVTLTLNLPANEDATGWTPVLTDGERRVPLASQKNGNEITVTLRSLGFAGGSSKAMGANLGLEEVNCDLEIESLHDRILRLQTWTTATGSPTLLASEVGALREQIEVLQVECALVGAFLDEVQVLTNVACEMYENAATFVETANPADNLETFDEQMSLLFAGKATVDMVAGDCGPDFAPLLQSETSDLIEAWDARVTAPGYLTDLGGWAALWGELRLAAISLGSRLALMGIPEVEAELETLLLSNLYRILHEVAYQACGEFHSQGYLADLLTGGFYRNHPVNASPQPPIWSPVSSEELIADIQYCASSLRVDAFDAVNEPLASRQLGGGSMPGVRTTETSLVVPADGFVELSGPTFAFFCTPFVGNASFENDRLVLRTNGVQQAEFTPSNGAMLGNVHSVSMEQLLEQLNLPSHSDQTVNMVLLRESGACSGSYAVPSHELFRVQLTTRADDRELNVVLNVPSLIREAEAFELGGEVYYLDASGTRTDAENEVTVDVSVSCGSEAEPRDPAVSGGRFTTTVTPAFYLEIRVTATGPDGQTATATAQPPVECTSECFTG